MATNNVLDNNSNQSFSSPNFLQGYTTTATSAGTTTLTVSSNELQYFTGTTTQTVVLPVTSTLVLGQSFTITNNSTGIITIQSSGANTVQVMGSASQLIVTCILTSGTTAASWSVEYSYLSGTRSITGGAANDILYQSAASTTTFLVPVNNAVLTTDGGTTPTYSTIVPVTNMPYDNTTIKSVDVYKILELLQQDQVQVKSQHIPLVVHIIFQLLI